MKQLAGSWNQKKDQLCWYFFSYQPMVDVVPLAPPLLTGLPLHPPDVPFLTGLMLCLAMYSFFGHWTQNGQYGLELDPSGQGTLG